MEDMARVSKRERAQASECERERDSGGERAIQGGGERARARTRDLRRVFVTSPRWVLSDFGLELAPTLRLQVFPTSQVFLTTLLLKHSDVAMAPH